ncbi:MAG: hypothetical protein IJV22_07290 [Bacteroidales bacterium]|nr:hypothetical protein [Bacteroidales bacterium]
MKKVVLVLGVAAMMFGMASCSKTCKCTYTVAGISATQHDIDISDNDDVKKCKDLNDSFTVNGVKVADADCSAE